jgi:hypothetical protein
VRRDIRHYSDLPYQYSRAGSFEIAFGRPRDRLPGVDDEVFEEMGRLLEVGLRVLRDNGEERGPVEGLSDEHSLQLFQTIQALTPPTRGDVDRIEIGGELVDRLTVSKVLTRDDRIRSAKRIGAARKMPRKEPPFRVTGVVEEADQGKLSFTLRQIDPVTLPGLGAFPEICFQFEDHLYDAVLEAFNSLYRTVVVGEHVESVFRALNVEPASEAANESPDGEQAPAERG